MSTLPAGETLTPRITLISALMESCAPASEAMEACWPRACRNHLLDDSLARDFAGMGEMTPGMIDRMIMLARYAALAPHARAAGILFTCSAFGQAIDAVKADLGVPVVAPNEGAFEEALKLCRTAGNGGRIAIMVTFADSLEPLTAELAAMATSIGQHPPEIIGMFVPEALDALQAGDGQRHDRLIAKAAATLPSAEVLVLGQFSMARAPPSITEARGATILTTPHAAVRKLRRLVEDRAATLGEHDQPGTGDLRLQSRAVPDSNVERVSEERFRSC